MTYVMAAGGRLVKPIVTSMLAGDIRQLVYMPGGYSNSVPDGYRILIILGVGMH